MIEEGKKMDTEQLLCDTIEHLRVTIYLFIDDSAYGGKSYSTSQAFQTLQSKEIKKN